MTLRLSMVCFLVFAVSCTGELEEINSRSASTDQSLADDDEKATIPANVSGAFLVCNHVEQESTAAGTSSVVGCMILDEDKESPLHIEKKTTAESKEFVSKNIEVGIVPPPLTGETDLQMQSEGSLFDFKLSIKSPNLISASNYLNNTVIVLSQKSIPNKGESTLSLAEGEASLISQLKAPLGDILEGLSNKMINTEAELDTPVPSKNYAITGSLLPSGEIETIGNVTISSISGSQPHNIYSIVSSKGINFGFGEYLAPYEAQPEGSTNGLLTYFFDDYSLDTAILFNYHLGGKSAIYSAKAAENGEVFFVGTKNIQGIQYEDDTGTTLTAGNFQNGYVAGTNPSGEKGNIIFNATLGQYDSSEYLYGLDFVSDGVIVVVGMTQREGAGEGLAGYTMTFDYKKQAMLHHGYYYAVGDQYFNDVSVAPSGKYAIAGLSKGKGCEYSKGIIFELDTKADSFKYNVFGMGENDVYFNKILALENGTYMARGWGDFSISTPENPGLEVTGMQEITVYLDTNIDIISAYLNDGTKINLSKTIMVNNCTI